MSNITQHIQLTATDAIITLFELDCSALGGVTYYFTPMTTENLTSIQFGGKTWEPIPIAADGFSVSGMEAPAKPTLTVSNTALQLISPIIALRDLVGATLTRYRTFERFLSTGSSPDSTALLPKDIYYISKKVVQNPLNIQWELSSILDKSGTKLPKRLFLRREFPGLSQTRFRT